MAEFKKGAFTVAAKEGAAVVPITLDGTGRLMRNGARAAVAALLPQPLC
jgi:1-acyl-sn-glycerol-3-phosphate acyltransferase